MECVGVLGSLEASMNSVSFFVPSFEHGHENDYKLMIKHIKHNETTHNPRLKRRNGSFLSQDFQGGPLFSQLWISCLRACVGQIASATLGCPGIMLSLKFPAWEFSHRVVQPLDWVDWLAKVSEF